MPPISPTQAIVCTGYGNAKIVPVRGNPNIGKIVYFQNFGGGYAVGSSLAFHEPNSECDMHNHRGAVEQFFVVSGSGTVTIDGIEHPVQAHDLVLVPVGAWHKLKAGPFEPFVVLCTFVLAPGNEDDETPWVGTTA